MGVSSAAHAAALAAAAGLPPTTPFAPLPGLDPHCHDFRVEQLMSMNGHLGMTNPFERPPLFGSGMHHPSVLSSSAASSPVPNALAGLANNAAAAAAIRDAQNIDFYSQRLKQLAGGSSSPGPESRKRNGAISASPVPFCSPVSAMERPDKRATPTVRDQLTRIYSMTTWMRMRKMMRRPRT